MERGQGASGEIQNLRAKRWKQKTQKSILLTREGACNEANDHRGAARVDTAEAL
jgi:hypothetical protein